MFYEAEVVKYDRAVLWNTVIFPSDEVRRDSFAQRVLDLDRNALAK